MKKIIKSLLMLTTVGTVLFSSCTEEKKTTPNEEKGAPSITVLVPTSTNPSFKTVDTFTLSVKVNAASGVNVKKVTITRLNYYTNQLTIMSNDSTTGLPANSYSKTVVEFYELDPILVNGDKLVYTITAVDDKGKSSMKEITVDIKDVVKSPQFFLGAPNNTTNEFKFFGIDSRETERVKKFKTGAGPGGGDTVSYARYNSDKIDFLYYYNGGGAILNAIYSPDYAFTAGQGWSTEISGWLKGKNKTKLKKATLTRSEVEGYNNTKLAETIANEDMSTGTVDAVKTLLQQDVVAFETQSGRKGYILIVQEATSVTGQATLKVYYN